MSGRGQPRRRGRPGRGGARPDARGDRRPEGRGERGRPGPKGHAGPPPAGKDVLYGRQPVHEALRAGRRAVRAIYATPAAAEEPWLAGRELHLADAEWITERCGSDANQGVCATVDPYPYVNAAELLRAPAPLIVALDEIQDVQNLGAICRTAECAGATGVVIPSRRSAEVTPAAAKASAGAVEHLPVSRVRNVADFLLEAKEAGAWCYGAAAGRGSVPWTEPDWAGPVVLVMGAEGKGLRPRVAANCDALVALPLRGQVGSLNVSAAAAALLYEIVRVRR